MEDLEPSPWLPPIHRPGQIVVWQVAASSGARLARMRAWEDDGECYFRMDPSWMTRGACYSGKTKVNFFPTVGNQGPASPPKKVCNRCTVQSECLEYALGNEIKHGTWGGLSESERVRVKRERQQEAALNGSVIKVARKPRRRRVTVTVTAA